MKLYLAGGHICGKYQQIKDFEEMKLYLASPHTLTRFKGGIMHIYLAGAITGNLFPAYKKLVDGGQISTEKFIEVLKRENFWQGGNHGIGFTIR